MEKNLIEQFFGESSSTANKVQKLILIAIAGMMRFYSAFPPTVAMVIIIVLAVAAYTCQFTTRVEADLKAGNTEAAVSDVIDALSDVKTTVTDAIASHGQQLGALTDSVNNLVAQQPDSPSLPEGAIVVNLPGNDNQPSN
jgi:hypothetical protein